MTLEEKFDELAELIEDAIMAEHEETGKAYCVHENIFPKPMRDYLDENTAAKSRLWHEFYKLKRECC